MQLSLRTMASVFLLAAGLAFAQTTIDSAWNGTSGDWANSNGWDVLGEGDPYPANNATYEYNVALPAGAYVLTTGGAPDVGLISLTAGAGAKLNLDGLRFSPGLLAQDGIIDLNSGMLELTESVINGGVIRFDLDAADAESVFVLASLTLGGDGRVVFRDNDGLGDDPSTAEIITSNGLTLINGADHSIEGGPGRLRAEGGGSFTFVNNGVVRADAPLRTVHLDASNITNAGTMSAEDLGTLLLTNTTLTNTGSLSADSGAIDFEAVSITGTGSITLLNGGLADFDAATSATLGAFHNTDGIVPSTGAGLIADTYSGAGMLAVDSTLTVNSTMTFSAGAFVTVEDAAAISVGEHFVNEMSVEADFDFNSNGALRFTSATGADPFDYGSFGTLEVASADMGDVPVGYVQNFSIPRLVIEAEAKVNLVDLRDNGNRGGGSEALYVETLTFADSNGVLNVNGLNLYYQTLEGNPTQIKDSTSATPSTWICASGNWNSTPCWDQLGGTDAYPDNNAYQYAVTLPAGAPYTVVANVGGIELATLDVAADATLTLASTFNPGVLLNAGAIETQGSTLTLEHNAVNYGVLRYDSDSYSEYINITSDVTLGGTGVLQSQCPSGSSSYQDRLRIYDACTLTNAADHTIAGGYLLVSRYSGNAEFINDGTVRSDNSRHIEFETGGEPNTFKVTNNNQMIAENTGDLVFDGVAMINSGSITADGADSQVSFYNDTTLDNESGILRATTNGVIEIRSTIAEAADIGTIDAANATVRFYGKMIDSNGVWPIDANYGDFVIGGGAEIEGITFESVDAYPAKLTGANLTNTGVGNGAVLEPYSGTQYLSGSLTNDGLVRYGDSSSQITVSATTDLALVSPGGTGVMRFMSTSWNDSYVDLLRMQDGATLTHGAGHTLEGGYAKVSRYSGDTAFINNGVVRANNARWLEFETTGEPTTLTVTNNNQMIAEDDAELRFDGVAVVNTGTITADGADGSVLFEPDTTLDNTAGTLAVLNSAGMRFRGTVGSVAELGTIDAAGGTFEFSGTLDDPGVTWLTGANYGEFVISSANITGIDFASADGNLIRLQTSNYLTDISIDATATLENQTGGHYLSGILTNNGLLQYDTDTSVEYLYVEGDLTLAGNGTLLFQNSYSHSSYGRDRLNVYDGVTLINGPEHKIIGGHATISRNSGTVAFLNQGEVRCDSDRTMLFDGLAAPVTDFTITNDGDMLAEDTAQLQFEDVAVVNRGEMWAAGAGAELRFQAGTTVDNTDGTLRATDDGTIRFDSAVTVAELADLGTFDAAGGSVLISPKFNQPGETWVIDANYGDLSFQSGTNLTGITMQSPDNHVVRLTSSGIEFTDIALDGVVVEIGGDLSLNGTFTNNGLVRTDSDSYTESLLIDSSLDLNGSGEMLFLNTSSSNRDNLRLNGTITVTNTAAHTIRGAWLRIYREGGTPTLVNDGEIHADGTGTIETYNPGGNYTDFALLNNNLLIAENGGDVSIQAVTVTNTATMAADGAGSNMTFASTAVLDNSAGLLSATNAGRVVFSTFNTSDGGELRAEATGEIELNNTTLASDQTFTIAGGLLDINNSTITGTAALLLSDGGDADFGTGTTATFSAIDNNATLGITDATVTTGTYTGAGALNVNGDLIVTDSMTIAANSDVLLGNDDRITVGGDYDLQMIHDVNYVFSTSAELRMNGGSAAGSTEFGLFAKLEVSGQDLDESTDPTAGSAAGFVNNFALPELVVGPGAKIVLVDERDNDHRGGADGMGDEPEALYVNTLTFEDGAGLLAVNGFHIYYNTLNGLPEQLIIGADCNSNGIPDNTDLAGGTSTDCNGNNIPDECDIAGGTSGDCNTNDTPDECDLSAETSDDCNSNSIPDECDIAAVTSFDINGNNIPDECEDDCNTNGIPDAIDISAATSHDCNSNGVPDECEPGGATSSWIGPASGFFHNPANWAPYGVPGAAVVIANSGPTDSTCVLDMPGTTRICDLHIEATGSGSQALQINPGATLNATDGTTVATGGDLYLRGGTLAGRPLVHIGHRVDGYGTIATEVYNEATLAGSPVATLVLSGAVLSNQPGGTILVPTASTVYITSPLISQAGACDIQANASLVFDQPLVNAAGAEINIWGGTLDTATVTNTGTAEINGFGNINGDLVNLGEVVVIADMQIVGDLVNEQTVTIQSGVLTVTGDVSGAGDIIGDFGGKSGGNGFTVIGDYTVGAAGRLELNTGTFKAGGAFNVAIDAASRFNLAAATLQMVGLPEAAPQRIEAAAPDLGRDVTLPAIDLFSIGTLRIGPTATTVRIVDQHDNSAGGAEAIYVGQLILEPGITLDLNGLAIYFDSVTPANPLSPSSGVTIIDSLGGGVFRYIGEQYKGDYDDDGDVDLTDHAEFPACLGGPTAGVGVDCDIFDFEPDGDIDLADFGAFQEAYTDDLYE